MQSKRIVKKLNISTVIHPLLFAIIPIFFLFSNNVNSVSPSEIIVPLLLVIIIAFLIWIGLSFVLKNRIKSGFITSLGLILFFSYGHIYILLEESQKDVDLSHLFLLIPTLALFGIGTYYFIKTKKPLNNATKIVNVVSVSILVISFYGIGEYFITGVYGSDELGESSEENRIQIANAESLPDIYYIILDAYAGSKALEIILNYDNSEFTDYLTEKGFYVTSDSFSNYPTTLFSISSTLNMKYLNYLTEIKGIDSEDRKEIFQMSQDNLVVQNLKSKGYQIFSIEAGTFYTKLKNADFNVCAKNDSTTSQFSTMLIRTSILNPIHVKIFSGEYREKILCGFSELKQIADGNDGPKFVFAHLMIPHRPYLFGPNGEPINPKILTNNDKIEREDHDLYLGQLKFANKKIQEVVEKLTETDTPPVIIIQSDHGMRFGEADNRYEDRLKRFNNFKAYYFPGKGQSLEFETTTPVNSFRILFNLYFDEQYELLEDRIYFNNYQKPYQFRDVTDIIIKN